MEEMRELDASMKSLIPDWLAFHAIDPAISMTD